MPHFNLNMQDGLVLPTNEISWKITTRSMSGNDRYQLSLNAWWQGTNRHKRRWNRWTNSLFTRNICVISYSKPSLLCPIHWNLDRPNGCHYCLNFSLHWRKCEIPMCQWQLLVIIGSGLQPRDSQGTHFLGWHWWRLTPLRQPRPTEQRNCKSQCQNVWYLYLV